MKWPRHIATRRQCVELLAMCKSVSFPRCASPSHAWTFKVCTLAKLHSEFCGSLKPHLWLCRLGLSTIDHLAALGLNTDGPAVSIQIVRWPYQILGLSTDRPQYFCYCCAWRRTKFREFQNILVRQFQDFHLQTSANNACISSRDGAVRARAIPPPPGNQVRV
jgi:hypothetical protein